MSAHRLGFLTPLVLALFIGTACDSESVGEAAGNGDGPSADRAQSAVRYRLLRVDVRNEVTNLVEQVYQLQYNVAGIAIGELIDENADGLFEHAFTYRYEDGLLTESLFDLSRSGNVDAIRRFLYDEEGLLQTLLVEHTDLDRIGQRIDYTVNERGLISGSRLDNNNNGVVDAVTVYRYNIDGSVAAIDYDSGNDGVVNTITRLEYDSVGRLASQAVDEGADGSVERFQVIHYEVGLCDLVSNHQPFTYTCIDIPAS